MSPTVQALLEALAASSHDPLLVVGRSGRVHLFSRSAVDLLGHARDQVEGVLEAGELFDAPADLERVWTRLEAGEVVRGLRLRLRSRRGEALDGVLNATLLPGQEGAAPLALLGFHGQAELRALERRLALATAQVLDAEERLRKLRRATQLGHSLAQPLTAAMGLTELMGLPGEEGQLAARLERLQQQLERMTELLRQLSGLERDGDGRAPGSSGVRSAP